ncbi:unnamed protein product, partial [Porites lobata]
RWRKLLQSQEFQDNLFGLVTDEAHVVPKWGKGNEKSKKAAFRECFFKIGDVRSLLPQGTPVLALTATATSEVISDTMKGLAMKDDTYQIRYVFFCNKKISSGSPQHIKRYRKKVNAEERSSGVSPEPTELDQALANIIEIEEVASTFQEIDEAVVKEKEDTDKRKAGSMRKMAMEKLGETQKREVEEGEQENYMKKKRSGNETISFLREKAESEKALREEGLPIR